MVRLVLLLVVAALVGGAYLWNRFGGRVKAEETKFSNLAKTDVKNVEADVKKVL